MADLQVGESDCVITRGSKGGKLVMYVMFGYLNEILGGELRGYPAR